MSLTTSRTHGEFADDALSRAKAALRALLAFVVFPNLLFYLAGRMLFLNRAWLNLDYAVLGAAWLWLPSWARVAGFAIVVILDAVGSTALMYNVNPLAGIVALLDAPPGLLITVSIGLVIAIGIAAGIGWFALRFLRDTRRRYLVNILLLGVVIIALVLDHELALNASLKRTNEHASNAIATSSTLHFVTELRDRVRSASASAFHVRAASDDLRHDAVVGAVGAENVVVITAESMGILSDATLRAFAWAPIDSSALGERYVVRRGQVAFRGGTTSGELRELCGIFADYITLPKSILPDCLPNVLRRRGFHTYSVHGFRASYYNRIRWYPVLFQTRYFDRELDDVAGEARCGTQFRGICDADAFHVVRNLARGGRRRLVYWMTLDAHTPVDMARRSAYAREWQAIGRLPRCQATPEVCMEAVFQRALLERLTSLALDLGLPPTRFLLVGDHAPAFVRRDQAAGFVSGVVPYIELRPKPARQEGV
jgi:hypothetical protein